MANKLLFLTIEKTRRSYISTKYPNDATITNKITFLVALADAASVIIMNNWFMQWYEKTWFGLKKNIKKKPLYTRGPFFKN
jgi:predicted small integral membrane protein